MFQGVVSTDIPAIWKYVAPILERSLKYSDGKYTLDSLREFLEDKSAQLWIEVDGEIESAGITQIHCYPAKKVCTVLFGAGRDLNKFRDNLRRIEEWAKAQGCEAIEVIGRKGWDRVMTDYDMTHVTIRKAL